MQFGSERNFLIFLILAVFLFFLFKNIFTTWVNFKQVQFTARIAVRIAQRQYDKYTRLPLWIFNSEGSANINNAVYSIPLLYVNSIMRPIFILFSEAIIIVIIVLGIFIYQPLLFLILVVVLLPSGIITYQLLKNKSDKIGRRLNEIRPKLYMLLLNTFNGFIELKLANKIKLFRERYIELQKEMQALEARSYLFSLIPIKVIEMVAILGVVTIFLFSIIFNGGQNLITLVGLFAAAAYRIMPSINRILTSLVTIKQFTYCIDGLKQFGEYDKGSIAEMPVHKPIHFEKEIKLSNITFSFPGSQEPVLKNININIKKGDKVGFIGTSGSGKTTLMNVVLGFYQQQSGKVMVDDEPIDVNNKQAWYNMIGYVKQDTFLMESSIKDNITLGDSHVDYEMLEYAIEKSSLKNFIETLPEGIETLIGERGSKLSGGQKQRIGIARALYKNAQLLLLDEATSALDNQTEREVSEAINQLSQTDITILIIAHRITTLRDCDRIYELKEGEIMAEYCYEDLIKSHI